MKAKYGLVVLLVAVLAVVAGGGEAAAGGNKTTGGATGGGWFIDWWSEQKITFGFNARPTGDESAEGEFQLVDHDSKTRIHGTFHSKIGRKFHGTCSINGEGDYTFFVICRDGGEPGIGKDFINIRITGYRFYYGYLQGGNIKLHEAK